MAYPRTLTVCPLEMRDRNSSRKPGASNLLAPSMIQSRETVNSTGVANSLTASSILISKAHVLAL
ncbi:hypothetical protein D3C71_2033900 [compost metagenome]